MIKDTYPFLLYCIKICLVVWLLTVIEQEEEKRRADVAHAALYLINPIPILMNNIFQNLLWPQLELSLSAVLSP